MMMATTYGSGDTWPTHQKAYWRDAMERAQDAGWLFEYVDAPHTFGWLLCPCGDHRVKVDKTAVGAESYASGVTTKIRVCEKARGLDSTSIKTAKADGLLGRAENLVSEAEGGIREVWAVHCANEQLERIGLQVDTADLTLQDDALQAVIYAEDGAPNPREVRRQVDDAEDQTQEAEDVMAKVSRKAKVTTYRQRVASLRERIRLVRDQLVAVNGTEQN